MIRQNKGKRRLIRNFLKITIAKLYIDFLNIIFTEHIKVGKNSSECEDSPLFDLYGSLPTHTMVIDD